MSTPRKIPRAETVGSLLRPPKLRAMFPAVYRAHTYPSPRVLRPDELPAWQELEKAADEATVEAVRRQIDVGLDVIADGEMRRAAFFHPIVDAVEGIAEGDTERVSFTDDGGADESLPYTMILGRERLKKVDNPVLREYEYLRSLTDAPVKVTLPAPSFWFNMPVDLTAGVYSSQVEFIEHVIEIQRELIAEVVAAGADYIQIDWPAYVMAIDPKWRDAIHGTDGLELGPLMEQLIALDNAVLEGIPDHVTKALHICRGNHQSMWLTEGSLEPIAEQLFNTLGYDRLLLEWDDVEREGDYSALRHLPKDGPTVVMGLVSTKTAEVETPELIESRLAEAARYADIDQLAISPQCGFASSWEGNTLADELQWRKFETVVEAADRVWGRS